MSVAKWWERLASFLRRGHRGAWSTGFLVGLATGLGALAFARVHKALALAYVRRKLRRAPRFDDHDEFQPIELRRYGSLARGVPDLIGNTPMMRIESLSELTGCEILGKAEFLNPGGSPKDRVALQIIQDAEDNGDLVPHVGSWIFEGTVGSTGISLATLARAKGYRCCIIVPDDVAEEKAILLRRLGATVEAVRPRGIVDPRHVRRVPHRSLSTKPGPAPRPGSPTSRSRTRARFLRTSLSRRPTSLRTTTTRAPRSGARPAASWTPSSRAQAPAAPCRAWRRT